MVGLVWDWDELFYIGVIGLIYGLVMLVEVFLFMVVFLVGVMLMWEYLVSWLEGEV